MTTKSDQHRAVALAPHRMPGLRRRLLERVQWTVSLALVSAAVSAVQLRARLAPR